MGNTADGKARTHYYERIDETIITYWENPEVKYYSDRIMALHFCGEYKVANEMAMKTCDKMQKVLTSDDNNSSFVAMTKSP